jgi:hypothetical protein
LVNAWSSCVNSPPQRETLRPLLWPKAISFLQGLSKEQLRWSGSSVGKQHGVFEGSLRMQPL